MKPLKKDDNKVTENDIKEIIIKLNANNCSNGTRERSKFRSEEVSIEDQIEYLWQVLKDYKIERIWKITRNSLTDPANCLQYDKCGSDFGEFQLGDYPRHDTQYYNVYININRAMILYYHFLMCKPSSNVDVNLEYRVIAEQIIILLATCLEIYLIDSFKEIIKNNKFFKNCSKKQKKQIKKVEKELLKGHTRKFQNGDRLKGVFKNIGISLPEITGVLEWEHCYSSGFVGSEKNLSYVKLRHKIIHASTIKLDINSNQVNFNPKIISPNYIKNAIVNVATFIYNLNMYLIDNNYITISPETIYNA